jgi:hypothetical protein
MLVVSAMVPTWAKPSAIVSMVLISTVLSPTMATTGAMVSVICTVRVTSEAACPAASAQL